MIRFVVTVLASVVVGPVFLLTGVERRVFILEGEVAAAAVGHGGDGSECGCETAEVLAWGGNTESSQGIVHRALNRSVSPLSPMQLGLRG